MIKSAAAASADRAKSISRTRLSLAVLTLAHTTLATFWVCLSFEATRWSWQAVAAIPLFALLFGLVAFSFWMASFGLARRLLAKPSTAFNEDLQGTFERTRAGVKTAILVPVYNESPTDVLAGIMAMRQTLLELKASTQFEFFVLSDTTDPSIAKEEERLWEASIESNNETLPIFYRRRAENIGRKSGNLEDFCARWGSLYEYMIVLDADSLMEAGTLHAMVARMEAKPNLGMLQVPPVPINRGSLFARLQQFAASVYGPTFTEGLDAWAGAESNYWGHNAIIRVAPFMQHCGLPILPGKAPLGGEILSHDFVEAALMLRANWGVELASDLGGSYEECPTNLLDFAIRDQRWCQGNLQHGRLVLSEGFHPTSRFHMAMGVLSYAASPLWLVFMVLSLWNLVGSVETETTKTGNWYINHAVALVFGMTMAMLLLPKLWGWIETISDRDRRKKQGGAFRLMVGVLFESLMSCLMAPAMMVFHTRFVVNTLCGRKISWNRQNRDDSQLVWLTAWKHFGLLSVLGSTVSIAIFALGVASLYWFLPISLGWVVTLPFAVLTSRVSIGQKLKDWRLLLIPEETQLPIVLQYKTRNQELLARTADNDSRSTAQVDSPHFMHWDLTQ